MKQAKPGAIVNIFRRQELAKIIGLMLQASGQDSMLIEPDHLTQFVARHGSIGALDFTIEGESVRVSVTQPQAGDAVSDR